MPRPEPGTVLTETERERIHAAIRDTCSASLMSDTKWRKVVSVLEDTPSIVHYFLKTIRRPEASGSGWLSGQAPHAFIDTFQFGPVYLREIEWLEFPAFVPRQENGAILPGGHHQDLEALRRGLNAMGKFPIEETSRGMRIVGHIRPAPAG